MISRFSLSGLPGPCSKKDTERRWVVLDPFVSCSKFFLALSYVKRGRIEFPLGASRPTAEFFRDVELVIAGRVINDQILDRLCDRVLAPDVSDSPAGVD